MWWNLGFGTCLVLCSAHFLLFWIAAESARGEEQRIRKKWRKELLPQIEEINKRSYGQVRRWRPAPGEAPDFNDIHRVHVSDGARRVPIKDLESPVPWEGVLNAPLRPAYWDPYEKSWFEEVILDPLEVLAEAEV